MVPRKAASVIVLRDAPRGLEVLMLRRADRPGDQNSGAAVFPGGLLDKADAGHYELCRGLDDAAASARLDLAAGGLDYWIAAVRECFEEAGLLFATDASGAMVALDAQESDALVALRHALHANETGMAQVCAQLGVTLAVGDLAYYSHWLTPAGLPKLFDTRFFVAHAPAGQTARHDATETVELLWITPAEALDKARGLKLLNVTELTLKHLAGFATAQAVIDAARAQARVPLIRPRLGQGPGGRTVVNPGGWAYAEIGRLDPDGRGTVSTELAPGVPVWLSPRVCRVTAPNGSMMTGPGTNAYFIGVPGGDDWALLDAGPDDDAHVQALLAAAPGRVTRLLVTHTHKDHSPAVAALKAATGAPTWGRVAAHPEWQDTGFQPDHVLADGDVLALGEGVTLRAVHTPGHASNHLCYLLEEEKLLFTGDHLMQGSTVVINPPDGDMAVYLASLRRLLDLDLEWLAPGHGFLIDQPHEVVRKTIAHRLGREAKVLAAVQSHGPADEAALLAVVYADTPKPLHAVALRSLRAHLFKLRDEGAVRADEGGRWRV
ncbi:MBL fold metallo-hydrolase [Ideonella sp. A 288]|uniref:MBL fold metallo-hydrolase n=1 Tax=Ideonella sp. A 288 TaxID=1962181 RepID=UPI0028731B55|nr:MBL fold metallo-hydrolase [Ideonella sp. A 288]